MRAIALFAVLVLAKALTLMKWGVPVSIWTPLAVIWQDVLVALMFAAFDRLIRGARAGWVLYGALVLYIGLNVPVTLVLSSPMTPAMMRATGGPLLDSITHYLNFTNIAATLLVVTAGIMFPLVFHSIAPRMKKPIVAAAIVIVIAGPFAERKVDTRGLQRNAFGALLPTHVSSLAARAAEPFDWRASPFPGKDSESLLQYADAASGRNVVVVILESTAAQYLKPYGAVDDPMPRLSGLAARSILFENAYSVYPESIKGLFTSLCSSYPSFNTPAETVAGLPCASIAKAYADAGYRTALFHSGRFSYLGMDSVVANRGFDTLEDAGTIGGDVHSSFGIDERSTVRRILSWIDALPSGQKFFLTYLPVAGHHPYATPEPGPFEGDTEISNYRNALHYADASLAELIDGMRDRHLDGNTVFLIFGDHGEGFGQHAGNFGHTLFIYDENVHVPFILVAPGLIDTPLRIRRPASLIDVAPTLLELTGVPSPYGMSGRSLLAPSSPMALFFTDYSLPLLGLRDSCWKYIFEIDSSRSKLFDVCKDPAELEDLSTAQQARVTAYRYRVNAWMAATGN